MENITKELKKAFDKNQERPNQYVVEYKRTKDDTRIGYHQSTFCEVTEDILQGKRYAGENPYDQLSIISKNLNNTLSKTKKEEGFSGISFKIKQTYFEGLSKGDVYLEAVYLAEGTPKQNFKFILNQ